MRQDGGILGWGREGYGVYGCSEGIGAMVGSEWFHVTCHMTLQEMSRIMGTYLLRIALGGKT